MKLASILAGMVLFVLAVVGYAQAEPAPSTATEAAVIALAKAYNEHPHYYEYGGVIVKMKNGRFNASVPVSDYHADNMDIDEDPDSYELHAPIVADYHTHPCIEGYIPGLFSPPDLRSMREDGHGGYILDECTGDVHYWEPGMGYDVPSADDGPIVRFMKSKTATGKIVGHIPVDGKKIEL